MAGTLVPGRSNSPQGEKSLRRQLLLPATILLLTTLLTVFTISSCKVIPAGSVGVQITLGKVDSNVYYEGLHFFNPISVVEVMTTRLQEHKDESDTPSQEGLITHLELSVMYFLDPKSAPIVFRTIGPGYKDVLIIPQVRSAVRDVTGGHEAKDLYTVGRESIARQVKETLIKQLAPKGIVIENILLRKIALPQSMTNAIEAKQVAEQESQRMQFVLQKEKQEAERKKLEAQGIADFQKVVQEGISDKLLQWKGIEATEHISKSPNTKVVVIGAGKSGLPIILGQ